MNHGKLIHDLVVSTYLYRTAFSIGPSWCQFLQNPEKSIIK